MKKILAFCLIIPLLLGTPIFAASRQKREAAKNLRDEVSMMEINDEIETLLELHASKTGDPNDEQKVENFDVSRERMFVDDAKNLRDEVSMMEINDEVETVLELHAPKIGDSNDEQEIDDLDASRETMFVTGIEGGLYEHAEDIPATMPYLHYRASDGALFVGTLKYYYFRIGYLNPSKPSVKYYQAFYEGTLTLQHYID